MPFASSSGAAALADEFFADVRHALRQMRRRPAFSALIVLVLGLGIGATVALYSVVDDLVIRALPYRGEDRIQAFWMDDSWRGEEYDFVRQRPGIFESIAAFSTNSAPFHANATDVGSAQMLRFVIGSAPLFDVLAIPPFIGRVFTASDDRPGAAPVAVVSYDMWQRDLAADPHVLGRSILLDGDRVTVIGVMPNGFYFPNPDIKAWLPLRLDPSSQFYHNVGYLTLLARARPGASPALIHGDVTRIARALGERFTYTNATDKTKNADAIPVHRYLLGDVREPLFLLLGTVALLLAVACANAAALVLARTTDRATELALRAALGAGRARLARQLIVESLVLGVCAAVAGAAMAMVGFRVLVASLPLHHGFGEATGPGWVTFTAALGLSVAVAFIVSIAPVRNLMRGRLDAAVGRERSDAGLRRGTRRAHDAIVAGQVAVAVLLVTGAMLLIRSLGTLQSRDPGFDPRHAVTVSLDASDRTPDPVVRQFLNDVVQRVRALPGVRSAGLISRLPLRDLGYEGPVSVEGRPELAGANRPSALYRTATPGAFDAIGFRLIAGRWIDSTDAATSLPVTVITESFAKRMWPNESAIGKRITTAYSATSIARVVVGVLREVRLTSMAADAPFAMYVPLTQHTYAQSAVLVVRGVAADATTLLPAVRNTIAALDPQVAITRAQTMQQVVDDSLSQPIRLRFFVTLFAVLALTIGGIGVYGVVSYAAGRRRGEFAVRMALGASPSRIRRGVLGGGLAPVGAGVALGLLLALGLARVIAGFLYGMNPHDVTSFGTAAIVLFIAGAAAALLPAIRAGSGNPAEALRAE